MKPRKVALSIFLILILVGTIVGCSSSNTAKHKEEVTGISILTCGSAGVWYVIGGGMAKLINENIEGVVASAEATGCSIENGRILKSGDAELALLMRGPMINAYNGIEEFQPDGKIPISAVINTYPSQLVIVTLKDSPINSVEDLRGKDISVGAPGAGTEVDAKKVLELSGIGYDEVKVHFLGWADSADALKDGIIDAFFLVAAHPQGAVSDLSVQKDIKIIPFTEELVRKTLDARPDLIKSYVPKGVYKGIDEDILTVGTLNTIVARSDLSDELMYEITKVLYEGRGELAEIHVYMEYLTPETAAIDMPIPMHPGAEKYFKEAGIL